MISWLIAAPSVSSINPQWDQTNRAVIEHLHDWLLDLGFKVETLPVPGFEDKYNLVASIGSGPDG
ncbi:MAG: acetylornithine deacetylase, partial [Sedimenticola sp.]